MNGDRWLRFVELEALKSGFTFVLDNGEGREMPNPPDDMYVEDLCGWLIKPDQLHIPHGTREELRELYARDDVDYVLAAWVELSGGGVGVAFNRF